MVLRRNAVSELGQGVLQSRPLQGACLRLPRHGLPRPREPDYRRAGSRAGRSRVKHPAAGKTADDLDRPANARSPAVEPSKPRLLSILGPGLIAPKVMGQFTIGRPLKILAGCRLRSWRLAVRMIAFSFLYGLLTQRVDRDLAPMRRAPMLEEINPLPRSERETAVDQRDRQVGRRQRRPDVRRHIIGAFIVMGVAMRVLRRDAFEKRLEIRADLRRGVLLDEKGGRRVPAEQGDQSCFQLVPPDPVGEGPRHLDQAAAIGSDREDAGELAHERISKYPQAAPALTLGTFSLLASSLEACASRQRTVRCVSFFSSLSSSFSSARSRHGRKVPAGVLSIGRAWPYPHHPPDSGAGRIPLACTRPVRPRGSS